MSEQYFYSSLTGQEIEDTLTGAVRFNAAQTLTTSQKQRARDNIGAGSDNTGFAIKGYVESVSDLPTVPLPQPGEAYGVGESEPYDIYVWDSVNLEWVNNGTLSVDVVIDDTETTNHTTWSSDKIDTELGTLDNAKQDEITAVGMLKGTGTAVQAATIGTDYTAIDDTLSTSTTKTWSVDKIVDSQAVKTLTPTVERTHGGTVLSSSAVQAGHLVQVTIEFKNVSTAATVGSNAFGGTISNIPLPSGNAIGASYSGSAGLLLLIDPTGELTLRVIAAQWNANQFCTVSVLYIAAS